MDYAFFMGGIKRVGNLDGERDNQFRFQRTPCDAVLQRHAIQKLHSDEVLTLSLVNLKDHADVGMVQGRSGLSFALEAAKCLRVFGHVVGQELEGDEAAELEIFGFVDDTHPATA